MQLLYILFIFFHLCVALFVLPWFKKMWMIFWNFVFFCIPRFSLYWADFDLRWDYQNQHSLLSFIYLERLRWPILLLCAFTFSFNFAIAFIFHAVCLYVYIFMMHIYVLFNVVLINSAILIDWIVVRHCTTITII